MATIMVVDDEPMFRQKLHDILENDGHKVIALASPQSAIDSACVDAVDLLIVDWMLKNHLTGMDVIEALQKKRPDMAVIFITGHPLYEFSPKIRQRERVTLLMKPFDLQQLRDCIRSSLESKKREDL